MDCSRRERERDIYIYIYREIEIERENTYAQFEAFSREVVQRLVRLVGVFDGVEQQQAAHCAIW